MEPVDLYLATGDSLGNKPNYFPSADHSHCIHKFEHSVRREFGLEHITRKIRVVVADDSRTALRAVCAYLEFVGQFEIVGTANDGLAVLHQAERFRPDLVLPGVGMPQRTGLQPATMLPKTFPELLLLIVSTFK